MNTNRDWDESYDELYNNAPCGYLTTAADGTIIKINNTLLELLQYQRDDLINKRKWQELFTIGSKMYFETHFHPLLLMQGKVKEVNFELFRKDRTKVPVLINSVLIKNQDDQLTITRSTVFDFTDRKKYEAELLFAKRRAEELTRDLARANKELEQFVYIASHDLQEPLRTVKNYLVLLEEDYAPSLDEDAKMCIDVIDGAVGRMQELIQALLNYSRLRAQSERDNVDIGGLVEDVLDNLAAIIEEKQATVITENLPTLPVFAMHFRQLLQNLISNAIKFSQPGIPPVIKLSARKQPQHWLFAVRDNGIGIDAKHYNKIFEVFKRLHSTEHYEGTGIGLAFCKKIVDLHQGKLWVHSELGEGSTFYFTIPHQNV